MRARLALVTALLLPPALVACGGGDDAADAPSPPPPAPGVSAPPPPPPPADPLTGVVPATSAPVVALKIDNSPLARPFHRGLELASVVYVELVEGGSTRFVAVYEGAPDAEVGPIRSVRESDLELLAPYGPVVLGYSGGNTGVLASLRGADLRDAGYDALPGAYRLAERRADARNFFTRPAVLAGLRADGAPPRDVGLRFGPPPAAAPVTAARVVFSSFTTVRIGYDAATRRYAVLYDGAPITGAAPVNVVVQRVEVRGSRYTDVNGTPTPYTVTTGTGEAVVLRDGTAQTGTWTRPTAAAPTAYTGPTGTDLLLSPGPTWVLLVPTTGSVTTS